MKPTPPVEHLIALTGLCMAARMTVVLNDKGEPHRRLIAEAALRDAVVILDVVASYVEDGVLV